MPVGEPARTGDQANPFFESWILESARRNLVGARQRFVFAGEAERIALPLTLERHVPGWLPTVARVWGHDHCYDTTPLAIGACRGGVEALFSALSARGIDVVRWPLLPMDTAFAAELIAFLKEAGLAHEATKRYGRPLLVSDGSDPDTFLKNHVGKNRLKDLRRRRRRMGELGRVEFLTHEGPHDAARWCHDFLELEASGWKGSSGTGTAIGCSASERAFFESVAVEGAAAGRIIVHSLKLDGKPVAMTVNFRSDAWLWAYKSAYREDLAHLAPGVQVELEGTRAALNDPSLVCFDSCTTSEHGVLGELWPGRRPIADLLIAVHPAANHTVRACGLLWRQYLSLKNAAKDRIGRRAGYRRIGVSVSSVLQHRHG
ncbi:MAG TPA: GNAT family N-acetyltransferase [Pararhizobium sp.]|nr:GNAT family N-acetyltransferase [Pararhizobium sp.]